MHTLKKAGAVLATLCTSLLFASNALAHHPTVSAEATCVNGAPIINFVSTSWSASQFGGENPLIQILLNGVIVKTGAYVYPANSFSGSFAAPAGDTAACDCA